MKAMSESTAKSKRRYQRIETPKGVWVAWQNDKGAQNVSRVSDLNLGGLFISTPQPLPVGTVVSLLLSVPEGEIRSRSTVRNCTSGEGMGVEFTGMALADKMRLTALINRLLGSTED
jgi:hypothetical protein